MNPPPHSSPPNPWPRRLLIGLIAVGVVIGVVAVAALRDGMAARPPTAPPTPSSAPHRAATRPPPVVESDVARPIAHASAIHLPLLFHQYAACAAGAKERPGGTLEGVRAVWQPLTLSFGGPRAAPSDPVNPFLDYRLQVSMIAPSGRVHNVPGYFDGPAADGVGQWRVRFAADEPGLWRYCASFRLGPAVAVDLDPLAGTPIAFAGATGSVEIAPADPSAPDFFRWGRLEYVGEHYLKFRDGPYWIKGGVNSPENFLGYAGFHNTADQGGIIDGFLHTYAPHVADSRPDDPPGDNLAGIIGALNYLGERRVNSIYFLPMNLGGDGQDTYPYLSPADATRFDVVKLGQWGVVLEHAQRRGIALHIVLNEVEEANRLRLGGGALGVERRLFYREMVARFAHLPALKWNLSEETAFGTAEMQSFAGYLAALDWADHPIAVHNPVGAADLVYGPLLADPLFSATSLQYPAEQAGQFVELWRARSAAAGRPWAVDMDENNPAGVGLTADNAGELRKSILYDVYFSGAAGLEWYLGYHELPLGGDPNLEDFRTREAMWDTMWFARRLLESLPFPAMSPADELLSGEAEAFGGGEVLALPGVVHAVYLPDANPSGALALPAGAYELRWYDPRTGEFAGPAVRLDAPPNGLPLGAPPHSPDSDWVALVRPAAVMEAAPTPLPYP
ncbi:MAG TPA: DUF5060 domain-containing protein [Promineifilum sp.]|nr:DUF5060 domain-containing protein [Promineifilum sp.]